MVAVPILFLVVLFVWELFHFQMTLGALRSHQVRSRRNFTIAILMMAVHIAIAMFSLARIYNAL